MGWVLRLEWFGIQYRVWRAVALEWKGKPNYQLSAKQLFADSLRLMRV
jgi:hypothetical protein